MDAHEIWAAAQLAPGEGIEDGVSRIEALIASSRVDAARFQKLCAIFQGAYDGDPFESEPLDVYCHMQSGWRDERQVRAELRWKDVRDEALNLGAALDAAWTGGDLR